LSFAPQPSAAKPASCRRARARARAREGDSPKEVYLLLFRVSKKSAPPTSPPLARPFISPIVISARHAPFSRVIVYFHSLIWLPFILFAFGFAAFLLFFSWSLYLEVCSHCRPACRQRARNFRPTSRPVNATTARLDPLLSAPLEIRRAYTGRVIDECPPAVHRGRLLSLLLLRFHRQRTVRH
jgi:hypothetical protein